MANKNFWKNKKVLISGVSFIGSHLVDRLVAMGVQVRAVNLTSKHAGLIKEHIKKKRVEFYTADLRDLRQAKQSVKGMDIVFHLACDHGGRGYVDLHQGATSSNFLLDGSVFWASLQARVVKVVFASSGCVYPNFLQTDPKKTIYLKEEMVKPPYDADNMYGWGKLMGELTLKNYYKDFGLKSVSLRYFTVYGERGVENHAVIAMIARAFIGQNPFEVWGTGEQVRNWTYVGDIVEGTLLAGEKIDDATAINLGTTERTRVIDAVREVLRYTGHQAKIVTRPEMPTGPYNRVADNSLAKKLLGWEPKMKFIKGLDRTIDWYFSSKSKNEIRKNIKTLLTEK
ncbi:GDP-L-fucose synthase 1 [Candidatus Gottesmanbacteria bacterium RIFCSPHIGHO2_02_FULL_39_14]|uniref:GDP-L-fucose synthase 1 n=1 Tax=Candidatus Gottesmanbacteria bacterium RIFCSPHIGHO2_02_FULL_39_14 TaxID=1798383 RepID=A0A1F5ZTP6_9BACT|nr:MAG: GDP-L-fucose synthase 1 [Candidatus Gottesmanbacteria bacterium RIFCSPHIGHO2_02_FULL_39_14]